MSDEGIKWLVEALEAGEEVEQYAYDPTEEA